MLGHDSDADVCYVSDHENPVDVTRESFRLQRELERLGFETSRYSGAAFRVQVTEGDGVIRGLDVFGGFLSGGRLYLMGEIGVEFESDWIHPLTTSSLEGVELPVPARPERLLEAKYGPGWRSPDPAFQFSTPVRTTRALNGWFRGLSPNANLWARRYSRRVHDLPRRRPSDTARRVDREARRLGAPVLDVGAGRGSDSLWLARRGHQVTAYDYAAEKGLAAVAAAARDEGVALDVRRLNLTEWRSVFGEGARLAHSPVRRVVLARHVLDATDTEGRRGFARWCAMALRAGGTLVADFHVGEESDDLEWTIGAVDPQAMAQWLTDGRGEERHPHRGQGQEAADRSTRGRVVTVNVKDKLNVVARVRSLAQLEQRVADLEADLSEMRGHNLRLAEITDVVQELLIPMASRDEAKVQEAIERFNKSL